MQNLQISLSEFHYPGQQPLLKDIDLSLEGDKLYLLRGDNGTGKSTLLDLICGRKKCRNLQIRLDGRIFDPAKLSNEYLYLPQKASDSLVGVNAEQELQIWALALGLNRTEITRLKTEFPFPDLWQRPYFKLSSGQVRAVSQIALPYLMDRFWILDEPFAGLDEVLAGTLLELLRTKVRMGSGALLVSHGVGLTQLPEAQGILLEGGRCIH